MCLEELNTIRLGEVAATVYSSSASILTVGGSDGCESIVYSWQEAIRMPAAIIMYVYIRFMFLFDLPSWILWKEIVILMKF